jgi:hypothetical protein
VAIPFICASTGWVDRCVCACPIARFSIPNVSFDLSNFLAPNLCARLFVAGIFLGLQLQIPAQNLCNCDILPSGDVAPVPLLGFEASNVNPHPLFCAALLHYRCRHCMCP